MELKIKQITFPEAIEFNFSELKQEIEERTSSYVGLVYSEDQIKDAKKDVAMLRKFTKALSDERIRVKKDMMKPYEEFEGKIKELTGIVDNAIGEIDVQIKAYEEQQKQEKLDEITNLFNSSDHPEWLHLSQIMNEKWLNESVSMKSIKYEIEDDVSKIKSDATTLSNLPEFAFEAVEVYKSTLDIAEALHEANRLAEVARKKAEYEAEQVILSPEPKQEAHEDEKQEPKEFIPPVLDKSLPFSDEEQEEAFIPDFADWHTYKLLVNKEQIKSLKLYLEENGIQYKEV